MAFRLTGNLISLKSILFNTSNSIIPSIFNIQIRHAKRKGYREKEERKKKKLKLERMKNAPTSTKKSFFKATLKNITKTIDTNKPDPPLDDVFIFKYFKPVKYSLLDAVNFHKEYHHPTIFNNTDAYINVKMEFDLTGKKSTQVINPFKGMAAIPHPFNISENRDLLVLCGSDYELEGLEAGAKICGGKDVVKKIKEGVIQPSLYDFVICHINFVAELTPIRNILKLQMPRLNNGTVTADLKSTIYRFLHGIKYECIKIDSIPNFGVVECKVGIIDMETNQIEENFKALVKDIYKFKPAREGNFITYIWCASPPSPEKFAIDVSLYVEQEKTKTKVEYDDDDDDDEQFDEKLEIKKLQREVDEEKEEKQEKQVV